MSQRIFRKEDLVVTMGYDRPLNFVFCVARRGDEVLYSNLHDENAGTHQQDVDYYRPVLASLGIEVPESMYHGVSFDQQTRTGNLVVEYPITLEKFLDLFCDSKESDVPEGFPNVNPGALHRGSTLRQNIYHEIDAFALGTFLPEGFYDVEAWGSYPYRVVWKHDQLRTIVCYCEGDVTVTEDDNDESYAAQMRSATVFYCGSNLRRLTCCCCGESAGEWLQHWNRDEGFGVCHPCVTRIRERMTGPGYMSEDAIRSCYGIEGVNWGK
jgi:hypothetical protein